uniref:Sushi domain-containing protein n=1 Tax=Neogobius melanostomus TaxID=47308 RepID=A0A8C6WY63_9GOBI
MLVCLSEVAGERGCSSSPPEYPEFKLMRYTPEQALYKCAEGYDPFGGSPVIRCSGGQWANLTLQCRKKPCGNAGELLNGYFTYEGESVLGDKAYAVCDDGYTLKGPKAIECGTKGWPTELPTCQEGTVTCSAPKVDNSVSKDFAHEYNVSDAVTITCSQGFQMKGKAQITCGSDGQWQPHPPQCVPAHEKNSRCGVPENTEGTNARLATKYSAEKSYPHGARVYYMCDVGYVSRGSKYRMCIKGQWTTLKLRCRRKLCGSAGELLNGHYTYSGVEFGDVATAVCDEGHQLVGHAKRNCLSRGWGMDIPLRFVTTWVTASLPKAPLIIPLSTL